MCEVMELSNRRAVEDSMFGLVSDGLISPSVIAERLDMSMDELSTKMIEAGYQIPDTLVHSEKY